MSKRYFIDYENTGNYFFSAIGEGRSHVYIFLTNHTPKQLPIEEAARPGVTFEFINVKGEGNQAMDRFIVFTLGRLSASGSCGNDEFVIVSNDAGYDTLIADAGACGVNMSRVGVKTSSDVYKKINVAVMRAVRDNGENNLVQGHIASLVIKCLKDGRGESGIYNTFLHEFGPINGSRYFQSIHDVIVEAVRTIRLEASENNKADSKVAV